MVTTDLEQELSGIWRHKTLVGIGEFFATTTTPEQRQVLGEGLLTLATRMEQMDLRYDWMMFMVMSWLGAGIGGQKQAAVDDIYAALNMGMQVMFQSASIASEGRLSDKNFDAWNKREQKKKKREARHGR